MTDGSGTASFRRMPNRKKTGPPKLERKHTVRCTRAEEAAVERLAAEYAQEKSVPVSRERAYILAVKEALERRDGRVELSGGE